MPEATTPVSDPNPQSIEDNNPSLLLDVAAVPVTPAVTTPAVSAEAGDGAVFEYEPTGDTALDMALAFMGKAGLGGEHPAIKAASQGDFSILKATLAAKGVQGWEQFVALGEGAYARETDKANKAAEANTAVVHEAAGGKESWAAIQSWASENASPEEKASINAQLNAGGLGAKMAVQYLKGLYDRAANVEVNPRDAAGNQRAAAPAPTNAPMGARSYQEEVQKLHTKLGGRLEGSREYAALQSRRQAALR